MLTKQKKTLVQHGGPGSSTALWLAQNPASEKLQSKQTGQISTTKFFDNQLKLLSSGANATGTTSTARVSKKQSIGHSPKHSLEISSVKKDPALIDTYRKK